MPVRNDTYRMMKRKMEIEEELKKIDEGIKVFQRPKVYVKINAWHPFEEYKETVKLLWATWTENECKFVVYMLVDIFLIGNKSVMLILRGCQFFIKLADQSSPGVLKVLKVLKDSCVI